MVRNLGMGGGCRIIPDSYYSPPLIPSPESFEFAAWGGWQDDFLVAIPSGCSHFSVSSWMRCRLGTCRTVDAGRNGIDASRGREYSIQRTSILDE